MEGDPRVSTARKRPFGDLRRPVPLPARRRRTSVSQCVHRSKGGGAAQGIDRLPLLDQYLEGLCGHAVQSDLARDQEIDRQQRLRQQPGDPAGILLLSTASRGARARTRSGSEMPWPVVGPYTLMGPRSLGLQSSLPAGPVHAGLAGNPGVRLRRIERHGPASRSAHPRRVQGVVRRRATVNTGRSRR